MARETTENMKMAEESLKKLNNAALKMNMSKKPLTEMERYQQSIDRTSGLLQKLEKQQTSIGKLSQIETTLKTSVEVTIKDSEDSKKSVSAENGEPNIFSDNSGMLVLLQGILFKLEECKGTMINGHMIMMNIDGYLISACNSLRIGNHNNLLWNTLNNAALNSISDTLVTTNQEIVSLREGLSNIKEAKKDTTTRETEKNGGEEVVSDSLNAVSALGIFAKAGGALGTVGKVAGPVGTTLTLVYTAGKYIDKFSDYLGEAIHGERVTKTRYPDGLRYLLPNILGPISRVAETTNVNTGEVTKYNWWGSKKEAYNENTGVKKTYGWFNNVKSEEKVGEAKGLNPNLGEMFAKSAEKLGMAAEMAALKVGTSSEGLTNATTLAGIMASKVDGDVSNLSNTTTDLYPNMLDTTNEKLALIQSSSTENMNSLMLLWDVYYQKVSMVFEMILLVMSMNYMFMVMNTMLAIMNIYMLWMNLPIQLGGVWQQILAGADVFLSSLTSKFATAVEQIKQKVSEIPTNISGPSPSGGSQPGNTYTGTNFWKGGFTYVGERGRELIQYPTGERFMAEAKMLMNLPKGTKVFRNFQTERMINKNIPENKMMTADENNQLKKLGGFNGLSDYTDFKFGGGTNYSNVQADNITINITNTYGNQSSAQIKDTNNDLVRKINEVLFQNEDRKRRVSIG